MKLTDREEVAAEYADEQRHDARKAAFTQWLTGPNAKDVAFELVVAQRPQRLLELGCGDGEFAARLQERLDQPVQGVDISPRMVQLTRARGVMAGVGDAIALPFFPDTFDSVVANWMLYHVTDLDAALAEIARVLRPNGALTAATLGTENFKELWELIGAPPDMSDYSFTRESGKAILERHFSEVVLHDVDAEVVFPGATEVREYVSASLGRDHLAERVPDTLGPFTARTSQAVFVATP